MAFSIGDTFDFDTKLKKFDVFQNEVVNLQRSYRSEVTTSCRSISDIKDGDILCFFSKDYALITDVAIKWISLQLGLSKQNVISLPLNLLYFDYEGSEFIPATVKEDVIRVEKMLGRCWIAHKKQMKYLEPRGKYAPIIHDIQIITLDEADVSSQLTWIYREDEIMYNLEALNVKRLYDNYQKENTKYIETLLSSEEGPRVTRSRFTWGEGYDEWDVWDVTEKWQRDKYYKGILVSSEIITRTHEENNR